MEMKLTLKQKQDIEEEKEEVLAWKRKVVTEAEIQKKSRRFINMIWNLKFSVTELKFNLELLLKDPKREHNSLSAVEKGKLPTG